MIICGIDIYDLFKSCGVHYLNKNNINKYFVSMNKFVFSENEIVGNGTLKIIKRKPSLRKGIKIKKTKSGISITNCIFKPTTSYEMCA